MKKNIKRFFAKGNQVSQLLGIQFKLLKEWYRNEAGLMLNKGNDSYERLR